MVGEEEYSKLLHYSQKFCSNRDLDYREIAHDVLIYPDYGYTKTHTLFQRAYQQYWNKEVALERVSGYKSSLKTIEHKYCYHCEQVLPLECFTYGVTRVIVNNYCNEYREEKSKVEHQESRDKLDEKYLKKLIRKSGKNEDLEVVRQRVAAKRSRKGAEKLAYEREMRCKRNKEIYKEASENLTDNYILDVFRKLKIPKEQVTAEMIEEKRQSIREKRIKKLQK